MNSVLTSAQWQLLSALCRSVGKFQISLAENFINSALSSNEIDELCVVISNEFMMSGIEETFEPNSYGRELELLLDSVNRGGGRKKLNTTL